MKSKRDTELRDADCYGCNVLDCAFSKYILRTSECPCMTCLVKMTCRKSCVPWLEFIAKKECKN